MKDIEEYFKENVKNNKIQNILIFIRENFIYLFENVHVLLRLGHYLEKINRLNKEEDPVFKLIMARLYSVQHRHDMVQKIYKEIDFNSLDEEFRDFYYYTMAHFYINKKKFKLALKLIEDGLEITEKRKKRELSIYMQYKFDNLKAITFVNYDDYDNALLSFKKAMKLAKEIKVSDEGYRGVKENLSSIYFVKGEFEKTLRLCMEILSELKDRSSYYRIYRKLAACYLNLNEVEKAQEFIKKAFDNIEKEKGPKFYYIFLYITLIDILLRLKKYNEAEEQMERLDTLKKEFRFMDVRSNIELSRVKFLLVTEQFDRARNLIINMNKPDNRLLFREYLLYKAILSFYSGNNKKTQELFEEMMTLALSETFTDKVIGFIYFIFLYRINEKKLKKYDVSVFSSDREFSCFFDKKGNLNPEIQPVDVIGRFTRIFL